MTTFNEMIDDTLLHLQGYTTQQDQVTHITSNVAVDALTIPVADVTAVSRGIIELGNELIWVDSVNYTTGYVIVPH